MLKKLKNLFKDESGQDIIEYGLLAFFISIVAIGLIKAIGPLLLTIYQAVVDALT
jgi:Flp pilus assembly pilin Flp